MARTLLHEAVKHVPPTSPSKKNLSFGFRIPIGRDEELDGHQADLLHVPTVCRIRCRSHVRREFVLLRAFLAHAVQLVPRHSPVFAVPAKCLQTSPLWTCPTVRPQQRSISSQVKKVAATVLLSKILATYMRVSLTGVPPSCPVCHSRCCVLGFFCRRPHICRHFGLSLTAWHLHSSSLLRVLSKLISKESESLFQLHSLMHKGCALHVDVNASCIVPMIQRGSSIPSKQGPARNF